MKICHVCGIECDDSQEICLVCGADLTGEHDEAEETENVQITAEPVLLATFEDVVSAEIFKDILTDNQIPYSLGEESDSGMQVTFGGGFAADEIYVDKSDFEKAEALYNEFLESEAEFQGEFVFDDEIGETEE